MSEKKRSLADEIRVVSRRQNRDYRCCTMDELADEVRALEAEAATLRATLKACLPWLYSALSLPSTPGLRSLIEHVEAVLESETEALHAEETDGGSDE